MRTILAGVCVGVALLLSPPGEARAQGGRVCRPAAVDHVPIAVHSVDRAGHTYERLGFRLKPGRPHENGLRNAFVKLPAGDYLELISPERGATDPQTRRYVDLLRAGEGGAFLALRVDSLRNVATDLERRGFTGELGRFGGAFLTFGFREPDLRWLFLIEYLTPVVDEPGLLAHPNTATAIESVWLAEAPYASLARIPHPTCPHGLLEAPEPSGAAPVQGVTLRVRSATRAQEVLRAGGLHLPVREDHRGRSVLVPAAEAHGLWIELLEPWPDGPGE